jgi:hypothetical protein
MPDLGLLSRDAIRTQPGAPGESLVVTGARWLQVTFEVDRATALALMPCEVSRPVPCYARLLVVQGMSDGRGIAFASLGVGGRYRMMGRNVHVESFATGEGAGGVLTSNLHAGDVSLVRNGQVVSAAIATSGEPLARVVLPAIYEIEPTMLRWDPWLTFAETSPNRAGIAEVTVTPSIRRAYLSKGAAVTVDGAVPRDHLWRRLRNLLTISACYAEGEITLSTPVIQQEL